MTKNDILSDDFSLEKYNQTLKKKKEAEDAKSEHKSLLDGLELYNRDIVEIPKLWDPFFQKVGIAGLVGSSDSGKSTFLRQLSLSIVLKKSTFLGFPLNPTHHRVLYISTEDDSNSISSGIRKQLESMDVEKDDLNLLKNIHFIFDFENLSNHLGRSRKYDLIVIDAFTDLFENELNSNTHVRQFLGKWDKAAKHKNCLIVFLHHIGKAGQYRGPNKNFIIGSQAFEAKLRVVLELRPRYKSPKIIDLWVLKGNFLASSYKKNGFELIFDDNYLVFKNSDKRTYDTTSTSKSSKLNRKTKKIAKKDNPELIKQILSHRKKGLSIRKIEETLKNSEFKPSRSLIDTVCKEYKD